MITRAASRAFDPKKPQTGRLITRVPSRWIAGFKASKPSVTGLLRVSEIAVHPAPTFPPNKWLSTNENRPIPTNKSSNPVHRTPHAKPHPKALVPASHSPPHLQDIRTAPAVSVIKNRHRHHMSDRLRPSTSITSTIPISLTRAQQQQALTRTRR